jgi:uncharacterized protein (TIGR03435 family)
MTIIMPRLVAAVTLFLHQQPAQSNRPAFEVISIKPNVSGRENGSGRTLPNGFSATNMRFVSLLNYAFSPPTGPFYPQQIVGGPNWMSTDRFDIQAKVGEDGSSVPRERIQLMVRSLLEDRFQLKWHQEMRDLPVYEMVLTKSGLKMKPSADQTTRQLGGVITFDSGNEEAATPVSRGNIRFTKGATDSILTGNAVEMSTIVDMLQGSSDRIIFDKTNLTGVFDIHVRFSDASSVSDSASPSIFTAIQELGLKLQPTKAQFAVIVIDGVQKPSVN